MTTGQFGRKGTISMTATDVDQTDAAEDRRRDRTVIAVLLVATFVVILNETIMNVALPRLMVDLSVSARTGQWLATAFMLTLAIVIPTTGFLLQRLSTRTVFALAMSLFSLGTALAAVSPAFWLLLPARVVQASGTAMMLPLLMTTILRLVRVERRGAVMGKVSIAISVAPAIGPTISGLVLHFLPWRFMFVLILPIALTALIVGLRRLVDVGERGRQRLDFASVVLSVPAFGGIVYGLSQLGTAGPGGVPPVVFLGLGLLALVAFGWRQQRLRRHADPLLDLRAFGYPMFSLGVALLCAAMMGLFGVVILLPIYLQQIHGIGALPTGLMLLPGGLTMGLLGPAVGKLFDRYGPRGLTVAGAAVLSGTMWSFSQVGPVTPLWALVGLHVVMSAALACLFTPAFTAALNPLPPPLYSHGSAILTTLQQVAGAAGTALLVAVYAGRSAAAARSGAPAIEAMTGGIQAAFGVATFFALAALGCAAFLRRDQVSSAAGGTSAVTEPS